MERFFKNGKVAVLISTGYGAGWYSWYKEEGGKELLFNPTIVKKVLDGKTNEITNEFIKNLLGIDIYVGGADQLTVKWVDKGTIFKVAEYDGAEYMELINDMDLVTA